MNIEKAAKYLTDFVDAGGTDDPGLIEAIRTVCGTQEQPTFILITQDRLAPGAIRNWINALGALQPNCAKLARAQDVVHRMMRYQRKNPTKLPD